MKQNFLGETGVRVSELCFGTMSFGGDADQETSAKMFHRCREAGINIFDCANVYAGGESERILGSLVKDCRDEIVLTSKAYFPTNPDGNARGLSRYHLVRAVEDSLRRLDTDRIDLFFLHRFDERTSPEETLRAVEHLVAQGKILYLGLSNFAAWQASKFLYMAELLQVSKPVCLQPMYNLVKRQAEVEILPMAQAEGLAVFSYSPLGGGLLSGKYGAERRPHSGRLMENQMYQTRYGEKSNYQVAEAFTALAHELGIHPAALAVAWVASHPGITAPIIGARNLEQLEVLLNSLKEPIAEEILHRVGQLSNTPPPATDRNEEKSAHNYGAR